MIKVCTVLLASALVTTACGADGGADPAPSAPSPTSSTRSLAQRVAEVRASAATSDLSPGLVVVLEEGSATEVVVTGAATKKPARDMTATDTVMVASGTKLMVAVATLRLVEQGKLSLADTVEKHVPGLLPDGGRITVEQLLSMTSGLPGYDASPDYPGSGKLPARALVRLVADEARSFDPGTAGEESNTNFAVLGLVVEAAAGRPLDALLRELVLTPARLTRTTLGGTPTAAGYDGAGNDVTVRAPAHPSAAAGAVSSASDLALLLDALFGGRLVSAASLADMKKTRTTIEDVHHGLGLRSIDLPCGTAYGIPGGNAGYAMRAWRLPDAGRTVVGVVTSGDDELGLDTTVRDALC